MNNKQLISKMMYAHRDCLCNQDGTPEEAMEAALRVTLRPSRGEIADYLENIKDDKIVVNSIEGDNEPGLQIKTCSESCLWLNYAIEELRQEKTVHTRPIDPVNGSQVSQKEEKKQTLEEYALGNSEDGLNGLTPAGIIDIISEYLEGLEK